MKVMNRLRLYHATLGVLAILAYITGEVGLIHQWLGYGVAAVIVMRLAWAATGVTQLGLMRFYPMFDGLKLGNALTHPAISRSLLFGIALSLIGVTLTGIAMDGGKSIGLAENQQATAFVNSALADDDDEQGRPEEGPLSEIHEALANILLLLVAMHVTYLLLFKSPLAKFMLFIPAKVTVSED